MRKFENPTVVIPDELPCEDSISEVCKVVRWRQFREGGYRTSLARGGNFVMFPFPLGEDGVSANQEMHRALREVLDNGGTGVFLLPNEHFEMTPPDELSATQLSGYSELDRQRILRGWWTYWISRLGDGSIGPCSIDLGKPLVLSAELEAFTNREDIVRDWCHRHVPTFPISNRWGSLDLSPVIGWSIRELAGAIWNCIDRTLVLLPWGPTDNPALTKYDVEALCKILNGQLPYPDQIQLPFWGGPKKKGCLVVRILGDDCEFVLTPSERDWIKELSGRRRLADELASEDLSSIRTNMRTRFIGWFAEFGFSRTEADTYFKRFFPPGRKFWEVRLFDRHPI